MYDIIILHGVKYNNTLTHINIIPVIVIHDVYLIMPGERQV